MFLIDTDGLVALCSAGSDLFVNPFETWIRHDDNR
jgi:hypothetical protein